MNRRSLALRAVLAALLWIALALGMGGYTILNLYFDSASRQFDARISAQLDLLAASIIRQHEVAPESQMTEPAFSRVYSGWYWQAENKNSDLLRSRSLWDLTLQLPEQTEPIMQVTVAGPDNQELRLLSRELMVGEMTWNLAVAADWSGLNDEFAQFRRNLILSGAAIGGVLLLAAVLMMQAALRPLEHLRRAVAERHSAGAGRIDGAFPSEVEVLVEDLNTLLEKNERLREKGRIKAANLAHAIKTPAAILKNEISKAQQGDKIEFLVANQAVDRIAAETDRHLLVSVSGPDDRIPGERIDAVPVLREIVSALKRLFPEIRFEIDAPDRIEVAVDANDLQEILGNLIENAGKWAKSHIRVSVSKRKAVRFVVADDGVGVSQDNREKIVQQGIRLDRTKTGTGLGLTIVTDIVENYDGSLELASSELGGLKVIVELPI